MQIPCTYVWRNVKNLTNVEHVQLQLWRAYTLALREGGRCRVGGMAPMLWLLFPVLRICWN